VKSNTNLYTPGFYDFTIDICDLAKTLHSDEYHIGKVFMDATLPHWRVAYGHLLHPCPYKVTIILDGNLTIKYVFAFFKGHVIFNSTITGLKKEDERFDGANLRNWQSNYKWASKTDLTFLSGITNKPFLSMTLFDSNY
jgi:hypothetical protein